VLVYPKVTAMISADCSLLGAVYQAMDSFGAEKEDEEFSDDGVTVYIEVEVETCKAGALGRALRDSTAGKADFRVLDD